MKKQNAAVTGLVQQVGDSMNLKRCCSCGELLPESEFNKNKRNKDGLQAYCKACQKRAVSRCYKKRKDKAMHPIKHELGRRIELIPPENELRARALGRGFYA